VRVIARLQRPRQGDGPQSMDGMRHFLTHHLTHHLPRDACGQPETVTDRKALRLGLYQAPEEHPRTLADIRTADAPSAPGERIKKARDCCLKANGSSTVDLNGHT